MTERTVGEIIGHNVRVLREGQLLSRQNLSDISWAGIAHLERGGSVRPRRSTVEAVARALGVTFEDLMSEELVSPKDQSPQPDSAEAWHPEPRQLITGGGEIKQYAVVSVPVLEDTLARVSRGEVKPGEALAALVAE